MTSAATGTDLLRIVVLVLLVVLLVPLLMVAVAIPVMGLWGGGMMTGVVPLWGVGMLLLWLVVLLGIGYVVYRVLAGRLAPAAGTDPALEELRMAYARGDVTDEEFEERGRKLRQRE